MPAASPTRFRRYAAAFQFRASRIWRTPPACRACKDRVRAGRAAALQSGVFHQMPAHAAPACFGQHEHVAQPVFVLRQRGDVVPFQRGRTEQSPTVHRQPGKQQVIVFQAAGVIGADFFHVLPRGEIVSFGVQGVGEGVDVLRLFR